MISVSVGVDFPWDCSNDCVMMSQTWQPQTSTGTRDDVGGSREHGRMDACSLNGTETFGREIVLCYHFQRLLKDFPKLDRFVYRVPKKSRDATSQQARKPKAEREREATRLIGKRTVSTQ